jgi:hypothetical protein
MYIDMLPFSSNGVLRTVGWVPTDPHAVEPAGSQFSKPRPAIRNRLSGWHRIDNAPGGQIPVRCAPPRLPRMMPSESAHA